MKKITKILLPIASTVAVVAPAACITSCGNGLKIKTKKEMYFLVENDTLAFSFDATNITGWTVSDFTIQSRPQILEDVAFHYASSITFIPETNDGSVDLAISSDGLGTLYADPTENDTFVFNVTLWSEETEQSKTFELTAVHNPNIN